MPVKRTEFVMTVMHNAVQMVASEVRQHSPSLAVTQAIEHVIGTVRLHTLRGHDPITRAYAAVLRHPKQARFDAKELERREQNRHIPST